MEWHTSARTKKSDCLTYVLSYIEAVGNYVKVVHWLEGQVRSDMLRATSKQMEEELHAYPMIVRSHRAFIVNLGQVEQIVSKSFFRNFAPTSRIYTALGRKNK